MERTDLEQWKSRDVARLLALVEAQRRYYQDLVASLPIGLLVLSSDLSVILANAEARKAMGLHAGEALERRVDAFLPRWLLERVEQTLRTGLPETGLFVETEAAGGQRRFRISVLAMHSWDNEAVKEALLTIEDLSDVAAAAPPEVAPPSEPRALESTAQNAVLQATALVTTPSTLIDNVNVAIWAVEIPSMRFVYVSHPSEQILGFPVEHWTGGESFWSDRVYPEDRDSVVQSYQRAIERGQTYTGEFRALNADGRIIWLRESARLLSSSEGGPRYLIGVTADVTERRLLEDQWGQSDRVEAVSKLASRMAHDLNNMLMILTGYGEELLNNLPAGSPYRPDLQEILAATERMSGLTSQLLAFTRKPIAATEVVQLEPVLQGLGRRLSARLRGRVTLELDLAAEASHVRLNAAQLEEVITAIIDRASNAQTAECRISIGTARLEMREDVRRADAPLKPGNYAVISITVPGPVPEGDGKACLFECVVPGKDPWGESAAAVSRAYGILRQWGGDLAVSIGPGASCLFRVFLPREMPAMARETRTEPVTERAPEIHRPTILVVEDEAGIRALVNKILRRQNYEVLDAANGEEALGLCRDYPGDIDLLITDVIMPEMGGRDLAEKLREQGRVTKVLFVSGYTDDASIYSGQLPPGTAFLQKPFTLGSLLDKVKEVLAEPAR